MNPKLYIGKCSNGYFARIDGQCLFDDPTIPDNPHTKPRKSFPIAEGLKSAAQARIAARQWVQKQLEAL
ncbi:MAG: hypothetical protein PVI43_00285 [Candidatus Bathyarchaeota archaeon]|jgi:hypothetical protein